MVKTKRKKQSQAELTLSTKFGTKIAKEIIQRRKLQISKFDRVTAGLDEDEISGLDKKHKTHKGRKIAEALAPKRKEDPKKAVFIKGNKCGAELTKVLERICLVRMPNAVNDMSKNKADMFPMEDSTYMMNLMNSKYAHLMVMGSTSKKRPNSMIVSRRFGTNLLDMAEFRVTDIADHGPCNVINAAKAIVITQGALWHGRYEMDTIRSLLTDLFYGYVPEKVFITGIERLVVLTALPNQSGDITEVPTINVKQFKISYKAGVDSNLPKIDITPVDMEMNLTMTRIKVADGRMMTDSLRIPREEHTAKSHALEGKNVSRDAFGNLVGKVHFVNDVEDLDKLRNKNSHANRMLERSIPSKDDKKKR